jgi:hypothetical protein
LLLRAIYGAYPDGRIFDRHTLIADVDYNFGVQLPRTFPWLVSEAWPLERILGEKTPRAKRVAIFQAGELVSSGLGLVPSGRYSHYGASPGDV